jgi:hypothetical protein
VGGSESRFALQNKLVSYVIDRSRVRRQDRIKPKRGQRDERGFESARMLPHPTISHAQQGWRPSRATELEEMLAASLP